MSCYQPSILKTNIREEVYLCCKLAYNFMAFALSKDGYNMAHRTGYLVYNSSVLQLLKLIAVLQLRNKNEWEFSARLKLALKCKLHILQTSRLLLSRKATCSSKGYRHGTRINCVYATYREPTQFKVLLAWKQLLQRSICHF